MESTSNPYTIPDSFKLVYQAAFKDTYIDEDNRIMLIIWNENSANISNEIYQEDALYNSSIIEEYDIEFFISDITRNKFVLSPEIQLWYAEKAVAKLEEVGLKRCAIIMDMDLNMMSSLEEIASSVFKRNGFQKIPHRFFKNLEEAIKWKASLK